MSFKMDVSIIIVNYKTKDLAIQCLESVYYYTSGLEFEIIMVDNHSEDDSVEVIKKRFPSVTILENDDNVGFGRANNAGTKLASGRYYFFLNSDTILVENVVKGFCDFMDKHNEIASCGCNLINAEGKNVPTHGCLPNLTMEFMNSRFGRFLHKGNYYINKMSLAQTIDNGDLSNPGYIAGADIFIRSIVFNRLGGFDPQIFMYFEETDLYARMKNMGLKSCLLPNMRIIHLVGGSFKKQDVNYHRIMMFERSKYYYYRKNKGKIYTALVKLINVLSQLTLLQSSSGWKMLKIIWEA